MTKKTKYIFLSLLCVGLIMIDIVTKIFFEGKNLSIIPNFLIFESTHNYGAGLGFLAGKTVLLIVLSIVFLLLFIAYDVIVKNNHTLYLIGFAFIVSGAIGNLIDRIMLGYVRDFIHVNISIMPYIFNLADVFLTIGIILFLIEIIFKREEKKEDGKNSNK